MPPAGGHRPYEELQKRLRIRFARLELLEQALTHRSFLAEAEGAQSNERLEFLGDAVVGLIVAEELFKRYGDWSEGELTRARAAAVDSRSLERVARRWRLGEYVRVSRGEESAGGRKRRSLLSDAVEAVIGAYYLDRGPAAARRFVLRELADALAIIEREEHENDYKTRLQEVLQARCQAAPSYQVVAESGPPHDRIFEVGVIFEGRLLGGGLGKSKKEAEQEAARQALDAMAALEE